MPAQQALAAQLLAAPRRLGTAAFDDLPPTEACCRNLSNTIWGLAFAAHGYC